MNVRFPVCLTILILASSGISVSALEPEGNDVDGDGRVTVLVPVALTRHDQAAGAYGSLWATQTWIHNGTGLDIHFLQVPVDCFLSCAPLYPTGYFGRVGEVGGSPTPDQGELLYLPEVDDLIHLNLRLFELSRHAQPAGVEIPVIREKDFLTREAVLLAVPVGEELRSTLRVFDPVLIRGSAVKVELLDPEGHLVATTTLRPGDHPAVPEVKGSGFYRYPGYDAIYNITDIFPELRQFDHFHVRLTSLTPGLGYWGFVSVTDNETQHVLLITPD
ncbi:MAG: hypothetical protein KY459_01460 [Acidobacteria bacterium]|nr:hypothetical protein [Acidobacteriota bacterium]